MEFTRSSRGFSLGALVLTAAASCLLPANRISAETWTDSTGTNKVDAQFVAVQGDLVVLKKANGAVVQVPLARLDMASQDLAKRLAKLTRDLAPDAYVRELMMASEAGDYQKIWNSLPSNYQQDIHDVIHSFADNMDAKFWNQATSILKKAVRVLKEKRTFILAHPQIALAGEALAKTLPPLTDALDATINSELSDLEKLKKFDVVKFAAADGKNIAEKLKAASEAAKDFQKLASVPGAIGGPVAAANPLGELSDVKASDVKITVISREGDSAVMRFDIKDKPGKEQEWVQANGKWLPKKLVDDWQSQIAKAKAFTSGEMKQKLDGVKVQVGFFIAPINMTLDQLLAAQTQEQFNLVIDNLRKQFGGAAPAGPRPIGR